MVVGIYLMVDFEANQVSTPSKILVTFVIAWMVLVFGGRSYYTPFEAAS